MGVTITLYPPTLEWSVFFFCSTRARTSIFDRHTVCDYTLRGPGIEAINLHFTLSVVHKIRFISK